MNTLKKLKEIHEKYMEIVKQNGRALEHIKSQTEAICLEAVK